MLGADKPPEQLGDYTGFLMNWAAVRSREAFARALVDVGLKPPQFGILTMIASRPGMTQHELVEATDIDPSTMVALLDHLEVAGLAERRAHESDRRKRSVYLTAQGKRALAKGQKAAARVGEETLARLTAEERREFHRLMRKVTGLD
jgi:MarR family transcriptional regulator, lower aerobic nicotinate degradation pathway regulator